MSCGKSDGLVSDSNNCVESREPSHAAANLRASAPLDAQHAVIVAVGDVDGARARMDLRAMRTVEHALRGGTADAARAGRAGTGDARNQAGLRRVAANHVIL